MNLYYLTFSQIPSRKANSIQVMQMCQAFAGRGAKVVLFCRRAERGERGEGGEGGDGAVFSYYGIAPRFGLRMIWTPRLRILDRLWYGFAVALALRRAAPGVVYSRDRLSAGLVALLNRRHLPIMLEVHAPPATVFWRRWIGRLVARPAFLQLVAISGALARDYQQRYPGLTDEKVMVAHDGANDLAPGSATEPAESTALAAAPSHCQPRWRIGYVGSLRPGKGMELIAQLAPLLPECEFHVVGGDEPALREWRQAAGAQNIVFHGFVAPARADAFVAQFDILLAPYQQRVMVGNSDLDISAWMSPLKLFEYMRRGKPIVASDLPVLREVLEDGVNALLAGATDPEQWRAQIARLLEDDDLRAALGARAQEDFRAQYTWDRRAERILERVEGGEKE
jgi:glycosyltransferase involved in cell wall biosynthesis